MKLGVFFLIFSLAFFAPADETQMHPDAQKILTAAETFVNINEASMPEGFSANAYINELTSIVAGIDDTKILSDFSVDEYITSLNTKTGEMLGKLTGDLAPMRQEYLEEVANFFILEYCNDMASTDVIDITAADYIADLQRLNDSYNGRVEAANAPETAGTYNYDPEDFLDKASGSTQRDSKVDFMWAGIEHLRNGVDKWNLMGKNLVALVSAFQQRFAHDAVAQADFQFLLDMWPGAAEGYAMNTAYDDGVYYMDDASNDDKNKTYVIDEYGLPTSDYESDDFNVGSNSTRYIAQSYNNRTWGYSNGTFDMATITTNGRKYSLAENFYTSPLILDLDGDGNIQASAGMWLPHEYKQGSRLAEFDMNGDGFADLCEWVGPQDGLLMVYDGKGKINGHNLFGNAGGYDDGYEKLLLLDKNHDNKISGDEMETLSVWQDKNMDAQVDEGEASSLKDLGITMLSLDHDRRWVSHFMQNGQNKKMFDWFPTLFVIKRTE